MLYISRLSIYLSEEHFRTQQFQQRTSSKLEVLPIFLSHVKDFQNNLSLRQQHDINTIKCQNKYNQVQLVDKFAVS